METCSSKSGRNVVNYVEDIWRLRGSKTDVEDAGLDADGMASSVSKLREELISLSGVDIMLNNDTFKSSYDILMGIGEVWDSLSDINRANKLIVPLHGDM